MSHAPYVDEVQRVLNMLDDDTYADGKGMATDILTVAFEMFCANHGKYTVIGQSSHPFGSPEFHHVALGWYKTENMAKAAAKSLTYGKAGEYRAMVLPVHQGTPAEYHTARKKARGDDESEGRLPWVEEWEKARAA